MKLISISTDRKIFEEGSVVHARMARYGQMFDELHIIVFSTRSSGFGKILISKNTWAYPTNSISKLLCPYDAMKIGKRIFLEREMSPSSDALTTQDPFETGFVGAMLKLSCKLPLVVQVHTDFLSKSFASGSMLNPLRKLIARYVIPNADAIRAVSSRIKRSVAASYEYPQEKIAVLPIHVDIEAVRSASPDPDIRRRLPDSDFVLLAVSRLTKEKQIKLALEALAEVRKKHPRTGLAIVGDGPLKGELEKKTRELGLSEHVVFLGWRKDVGPCYKAADSFIATSLYEGYGMTLVEAAAAGCPIVTTDVGVAPDLIEDGVNSFMCSVNDVECLSSAIIRLIENPEERRMMSQNIAQKLGEFVGNIEESLERQRNIFDSLVGR